MKAEQKLKVGRWEQNNIFKFRDESRPKIERKEMSAEQKFKVGRNEKRGKKEKKDVKEEKNLNLLRNKRKSQI